MREIEVRENSPKAVKIQMLCITDGNVYDFLDDGVGKNTGDPGPRRALILEALKKISPLDGEPLFLLKEEVEGRNDRPPLTHGMRGYVFKKEDEERLEKHLAVRNRKSAEFQSTARGKHLEKEAEERRDDSLNVMISAAVKAAVQATVALKEVDGGE